MIQFFLPAFLAPLEVPLIPVAIVGVGGFLILSYFATPRPVDPKLLGPSSGSVSFFRNLFDIFKSLINNWFTRLFAGLFFLYELIIYSFNYYKVPIISAIIILTTLYLLYKLVPHFFTSKRGKKIARQHPKRTPIFRNFDNKKYY